MLFGRSVVCATCLLCVAAVASAEPESKTSSEAALSLGAKSDSGKLDAKADSTLGTKPATKKDDAEAAQVKPAAAPSKDVSGVRRDPNGKKGISPFWEAIRQGDEAAMARDLPKAEAAYQAAIGLDPKNPVGHFRKGQILVRAQKLGDAETAYQDALRLAGTDTKIHAAALFVLADLKERQADRDAAIAAWKAYAEYLKADSSAAGYPETPAERDRRLKKYQALLVEGKAVRERIQLRLKEVDEAAKRKAAKNPNEGK
jgi:tetratricopeptide (TPR) repeat protein